MHSSNGREILHLGNRSPTQMNKEIFTASTAVGRSIKTVCIISKLRWHSQTSPLINFKCKSTTLNKKATLYVRSREKKKFFFFCYRAIERSSSVVRLCRRRSFLLIPRRRRPSRINAGVQLYKALAADSTLARRLWISDSNWLFQHFSKINHHQSTVLFLFWSKKSGVFISALQDEKIPPFQTIRYVFSKWFSLSPCEIDAFTATL